ncbi:MAG TPA: hypothetical protein VMV03_10390 [Spirochaetia bacterium]|nr:hypothetical protein [Spirochaetia bacterium]
MLQFYFLSIVANFLAGVTLSSDWISRRIPSLASIVAALSARRAKLILGLASLLVGVGTLLVPVEGAIIIGDLFPSVIGMAMGVALLFEFFRQEAVLPLEHSDKAEKLPVGYRTTLGMLGIAAAVLHFFLPERTFL